MDRTKLLAACTDLPLFPLSGTTLMPGSLLPLHVFESQHVALVKACLADRRPLAVTATLEDGEPGDIYPYAGVGIIGAHQELDGGTRFNVLIQPIGRIHIDGYVRAEPFPAVRATLLEDTPLDATADAQLIQTGEWVRVTFGALIQRMGPVGVGAARALDTLPAFRVCECAASVVIREMTERQIYLASNNPLRRALMVRHAVYTLLGETRRGEAAEA